MKELAEQMKDAMANLQAQHGLTADQANVAIAQAIAPLVTQINAIQATELSTEEKLTQVTAAVQEVADTFAPQEQATDGTTAAEPATDMTPAA